MVERKNRPDAVAVCVAPTALGGKIRRVSADFDLFDDAANVLIVDFVDGRGHGGGFAGARCAAEEHEAAGKPGQIFDGWGKDEVP